MYFVFNFGIVLRNYVYYGETRGPFFTTSNGVRQCGILSPKLFFVYMDDLSKLLINSGIGCFIDNVNFVLIMCFMRTTYVLWRHAQ